MKILASVALIALSVSLPLHAQSLAEAAKKAEEAHAAAKKSSGEKTGDAATKPPTKIYSNKDLKDVPSTPVAAGAAEPAPVSAPTESTVDAKDKPVVNVKKDESYWKARMRELLAQLASDTASNAATQTQLKGLSDYVRPDGSMVPVVADNVFKAQAELNRTLAAIQTDKRAITDLEEEARRAGVPPGWLRP